jgi:drug/metabolite transporter (DMT)-like permease
MCYAGSFLLYVNVLSETRLSIAYPFMGLTYVLVVAASTVFLEESIGPKIFIGSVLIFAGIALIGTEL